MDEAEEVAISSVVAGGEASEVLELVEERKAARKEKNFAKADEIRDKIAAMGYAVEETRQGTRIYKKS